MTKKKAIGPDNENRENMEGLTWEEWLQAAGFSVGDVVDAHVLMKLGDAWRASEDPAEHRMNREPALLRQKIDDPKNGEHVSRIKCGKCGNTESREFRYVEAIEVYRPVVNVFSGVIAVESRYQTGEGYDDGIKGSEYFECHARGENGCECLHRMPVPDFVKNRIDWV